MDTKTFGIVFLLLGVIMTIIIPILVHLYPRLPLIPSPKSWEKLPDEVQLDAIKKLRGLCIKMYMVGGVCFIMVGVFTIKSKMEYHRMDTKRHVKRTLTGKKVMPKVPGASNLFNWFVDGQREEPEQPEE